MSLSQRRVSIAAPGRSDGEAFVAAARASRELHAGLVSAPRDLEAYRMMIARDNELGNDRSIVRLREGGELVGMFNISAIVRGNFQSAFLGFYAFAPHAGRGLMSEGLRLVLQRAFGPLKLHRLEANIQPENRRSLALVARVGFRKEGLSPRYLKVGGRWRDHVRTALLAEEWRRR